MAILGTRHERAQFLVHINSIIGVGPVFINALIDRWPDYLTIPDFYLLSSSERARLFDLTSQQLLLLSAGLAGSRETVDKEWDYLSRSSTISIVMRDDADYPELLKHIYAPPPLLYVAGKLPQHTNLIACVGSRESNAYGERMVSHLIPSLVRQGMSIVSGGARGIDTLCHRQAVQEGGSTVVVLGSGLLNLYPSTNKKMFDDIVGSGGALVSSFPLKTAPQAGNFPARNRIIAGMSKACLVIQAAVKSGALITSSYALEQGKEIFAVPGSIDDPLSVGCNSLIQEGATIVVSQEMILSQLGYSSVKKNSAAHDSATHDSATRSSAAHDSVIVASRTNYGPDSLEDKIIALCAAHHGLPLDDIMMYLQESLTRTQSAISLLACDGIIEQDFSGLWKVV